MNGLIGLLNLGTRSLNAQRAGVEVAGQNLANVNNPAYARQRVVIQTSPTVRSSFGPQGTGADVVAIQQVRDVLIDRQIGSEASIGGSLNALKEALETAQSSLGEVLDLNASPGLEPGFAADLNRMFDAFRSVSNSPNSFAERQQLVFRAQDVASKLNQIDGRLSAQEGLLNDSLGSDVRDTNLLLSSIADLNNQIGNSEMADGGTANDLRDLRQAKLEELSKLIKVDISESVDGALSISANGNSLVSGGDLVDTIEEYRADDGRLLVRTAGRQTWISPSGGHMQGLMEARDGVLKNLHEGMDALAKSIVDEVNAVHMSGFAPNGTTGAAFFGGVDAGTIRVSGALEDNPWLLQLSGNAGNSGDNRTALELAQIGGRRLESLNGQTVRGSYNDSIGRLDQALSSINGRVADQKVVQEMLTRRREDTSGVSIDEEMSDLLKYQKAFQASAKLVSTVDEMLDTVINMKR